jgi:hypothetical protein
MDANKETENPQLYLVLLFDMVYFISGMKMGNIGASKI